VTGRTFISSKIFPITGTDKIEWDPRKWSGEGNWHAIAAKSDGSLASETIRNGWWRGIFMEPSIFQFVIRDNDTRARASAVIYQNETRGGLIIGAGLAEVAFFVTSGRADTVWGLPIRLA
jgi:hypothetical protein